MDDPLDDLLRSTRAARRSSADALDDLIGASGASPRSDGAPPRDRADRRRRWEWALSLSLFLFAFAGVLTDAVAASQLIGDGGASSLVLVWPVAGAVMLAVTFGISGRVDRFARVRVLVWAAVAYAVAFVVVLGLIASGAPVSVPSALAWVLADQMNFLVPLVIWALAGDVFTAGQGISVFPRMSRWLLGGQLAGLVVATASPFAFDAIDVSLGWLLVLPPVACVAVALIVPRALRDAATAAGTGEVQTAARALSDTRALVGELPAFRWLLRVSFIVMAAGAIIEFGFLDVAGERFDSANDIQVLYAGVSLVGFCLAWLVQSTVTARLLNRRGVGAVLRFLPAATVIAAVLLLFGGLFDQVALASVALLAWRVPRWSLDASARQAAQATLPDERRARSSLLIDLVPVATGLILVAVPIGLSIVTGSLWVAPLAALILAICAFLLSARIAGTWDDTQLSYRLKRRRRLG
jgi:hypothetical protein